MVVKRVATLFMRSLNKNVPQDYVLSRILHEKKRTFTNKFRFSIKIVTKNGKNFISGNPFTHVRKKPVARGCIKLRIMKSLIKIKISGSLKFKKGFHKEEYNKAVSFFVRCNITSSLTQMYIMTKQV